MTDSIDYERRIAWLEQQVKLLLTNSRPNQNTSTDSAVKFDSINVGAVTGATAGMVKNDGAFWNRVDGSSGGFVSGTGGDVLLYRSAADTWRTPDSLTVDAILLADSLNVGTTGATSGEIRANAMLRLSGVTDIQIKMQKVTALANNGTVALMAATNAGLVIVVNGNAEIAQFNLRGAAHASQEVSDASAVYSITAGTAGTNIYWSAGNVRYELENKSGGVLTYYITFLGF